MKEISKEKVNYIAPQIGVYEVKVQQCIAGSFGTNDLEEEDSNWN